MTDYSVIAAAEHYYSEFSDYHKDAFGYRPRKRDAWLAMSDAERDAEWAWLDSVRAEQEREEAEVEAWEAEVEWQEAQEREALAEADAARSLLDKALEADDAPSYAVPSQRRKARRYGRPAGDEPHTDIGWTRLLHCGCVGCNGRTWKRFRKAQYRTVKVG